MNTDQQMEEDGGRPGEVHEWRRDNKRKKNRPDGHRLLHTRLRLGSVCWCRFVLMAWLIYTSLELVISAACCLGNVLVVWAVCLRRTLRQPTFCFVASLAVADFLVGAVAVPLAVLVDGWLEIPFQACLAVSCVLLVLTQASVLSLLAIAVDRYLRVSIPLRYKEIATERRSWIAVVLCWLISCLLGFTPLFGWHNGHSQSTSLLNSSQINCTFLAVISLPYMVYFNYLGCILLPLAAMTLLYALVFYSLRKRLRREDQTSTPAESKLRAFLIKEKRLACSLALVLLLFAACWMPLHVMNCVSLSTGPRGVPQIAFYAGILLSHANSAVNPVVYAFRIAKIREAYLEIWRRYVLCWRGRGDFSSSSLRSQPGEPNTGHHFPPTLADDSGRSIISS
ncbi:adenosine receptor A1-like [Puntigrus tetrazona]|uniref:adenosine receptor A1-like n=1 Tax=Puntigrus tetrazona TaxID=1606681 RepID=UPI001C8A42A8|nr:adenosine receptor A1-like [Puntigrus tetrazona]